MSGSAWWSCWAPVSVTFCFAGKSRWLSMWRNIATSSGPGLNTPPAARRWSTQASSVWHTMRHRDTSAASESEPKLQLELCLKPEPERRAPFIGAKTDCPLSRNVNKTNTHTHIPTMHITHTHTYIYTNRHILGINIFFYLCCRIGKTCEFFKRNLRNLQYRKAKEKPKIRKCFGHSKHSGGEVNLKNKVQGTKLNKLKECCINCKN